MSIQSTIKEVKERWHAAPGVASVDAFDDVERVLAITLPSDYKYFMMWSDGGEADLPEAYVALYPLGELLAQQVPEMSGFVVFGTEGDHVFAFDTRGKLITADYEVVEFSLASRDVDEVEVVARDFEGFLRSRMQSG